MIPVGLGDWMIRHGVTMAAMAELAQITGLLGGAPPPPKLGKQDESYVQSLVRLEAPRQGVWLGRNNVGALMDKDGRPVRFGLANDSAKVNEVFKSGDLIGIRKVLVTPAHVGRTIGQFVSREIKEPGWTYTGTPREVGQNNWAMFVNAWGGDAKFASGPGTL